MDRVAGSEVRRSNVNASQRKAIARGKRVYAFPLRLLLVVWVVLLLPRFIVARLPLG